jgi:hypothetical protein
MYMQIYANLSSIDRSKKDGMDIGFAYEPLRMAPRGCGFNVEG